MGKLILVRHGKSYWNIEKIFTGWTDIDIAPEGVEEAKIAGTLIRDYKIFIDICFSSYLKRAIRTALIILETADMMQIDIIKSWKLNERNYGAWQGRKKADVQQEVGEALFTKIRRGYSTPPPKLLIDDERHPRFEEKYKDVDPAILPTSESLEDTKKRAVQYYFEAIVPELVKNKTVLVSAHGNSIRALMAEIETISAVEISKVEVQTGILNIYEFDSCMFLENKYQLEEKKEVFV